MNRSLSAKIFAFSFLLLTSWMSYAQKPTKVTVQQADALKYSKALGENVHRLIGHVIFEHDGALMYCDSALINDLTNSVQAFGNIHIKISDTLNLYGKTLNYYGDTRTAEVIENVRLIDKQTTLTTDRLLFDRNTSIASYVTGGHIVSGNTRLSSKKGYYHTDVKQFFFKESVVVNSPKNTMESDTLMYNTMSKTAYFLGPTIIKGTNDKNYIYCENGWYNTKTDVSRFSKNTLVVNGNQRLTGDSLYYDKRNDFGRAFRHVVITDTVNKMIIKGDYAEYSKGKGYSMVTGQTQAILIDAKDSLFLHSDTLYTTLDNEQKTRDLFAYHHAKFYRHDLQGASDSILYRFSDSTILMYKTPILWADNNQLTADSIYIITSHKEVKKMMLYSAAFIVSKDSLLSFNQIKGKNMVGYFRNNNLSQINVTGNAETLYFVREDDKTLIGVNRAIAGNMHIYLKDKKINGITYIENPTATLYPEKDVKESDVLLKDFMWHVDQRPKNKTEIFNWKENAATNTVRP